MARSKKPGLDVRTAYRVDPLSLTNETAINLAAILEIDEDSDAVALMKAEVEAALGRYNGMVETMDNAPRHTAIVAALEPIQKQAKDLQKALLRLDDVSLAELVHASSDDTGLASLNMDVISNQLGNLSWVSSKIVAKKKQSMGGPKKEARYEVIYSLLQTYNRYTQANPPAMGSMPEVDAHSDIQKRQPKLNFHRLKIDFISAALDVFGSEHPNSDELARLFPKAAK